MSHNNIIFYINNMTYNEIWATDLGSDGTEVQTIQIYCNNLNSLHKNNDIL